MWKVLKPRTQNRPQGTGGQGPIIKGSRLIMSIEDLV